MAGGGVDCRSPFHCRTVSADERNTSAPGNRGRLRAGAPPAPSGACVRARRSRWLRDHDGVAARADEGEVVDVVGGGAVPAVGVDAHRRGVRAGGERGGELLPGSGGLGPGGDVGGAGAGGAEVDVAALHPGAQGVRGVGLDRDGLGALGVVAAGRRRLEREGAGALGCGDGSPAGVRAAPAVQARLEAAVAHQVHVGGARHRSRGDQGSDGEQAGEQAARSLENLTMGPVRSTTASAQGGIRGVACAQHGPDQ
ncbi:hypothetical protein SBADM41S_06030 [Streptomyces badius]